MAQRRVRDFARLSGVAMLAVVGVVAIPAGSAQAAPPTVELVTTRLFDGTQSGSPTDKFTPETPEDPIDNGDKAPAPHTPGLDSGPTNNVVRTWDLFAVQIDYDVNEGPANNVKITATLPPIAKWAPSDANNFSGCESTDFSADMQTMTCLIGAVAEGTHGAIRPVAKLVGGVDNDIFNVPATITTDEGATATDQLDVPLTVSERPAGDWRKLPSKAYQTSQTSDYIVVFPLALVDPTNTAEPTKGSGRMSTTPTIEFYDHAARLPAGARLATKAQLNAVGIEGEPCGTYDKTNKGPLPLTSGTWQCTETPVGPNGYSVTNIKVSNYATTAPQANVDGTPNSLGYVISGQIAYVFPYAQVQADIKVGFPPKTPAGNAFYLNFITSALPSQNLSGFAEQQDVPPITVYGSTEQPESILTNNSSTAGFGDSGTSGGDGASPVMSHYAMFAKTNDALQISVRWPSDRPENTVKDNPFGESIWDGRGPISRGQDVNMQMWVGTLGGKSVAPIHGCMAWSPEQIYLSPMEPLYTSVYSESIYYPSSYKLNFPTGTLENVWYGNVIGSYWRGKNFRTNIIRFPDDVLAKLQVIIEYAYDPGISDTVDFNRTECNNASRTWVNSTDTPGLDTRKDPVTGLYNFNMVRVRTVGDFPWGYVWSDLYNPYPSKAAQSGIYLIVSGKVGTDLTTNFTGKRIYVHSSRSEGVWDPATEDGPPFGKCKVVTSNADSELNDHPTGGKDGLEVQWCSRPYDPQTEFPSDHPNQGLSESGFSVANYGTTGTILNGDSDTDKVTIVDVSPAIDKRNVAGVQDVKDNGESVEYELRLSAVGATSEALANVTVSDPLPEYYTFEAFTKQPVTPGATCEYRQDTRTIFCQMSEPDPTVDTGPLPEGLPGGWRDLVRFRVRVTGAVANATTYKALSNTATIQSKLTGPWDAGKKGFTQPATPNDQKREDTAFSYLPLAHDRAAVIKAVKQALGPCTLFPLAPTLPAGWGDRCTMIQADSAPPGPAPDANGNIVFNLSYTNYGNTRLKNVTLVDVFPYNGDAIPPEQPSNSAADGANPSTVGDQRWPGSAFSGQVGLKSVGGGPNDSVEAFWVTADPPNTISRDPQRTVLDNTWCDAVNGKVVVGSGACPTSNWQVTAIYAVIGDVYPEQTKGFDLTLDTGGNKCQDFYTNTFGGRADNLLLPIRSNDVSAMVSCEYDLALRKVVRPGWAPDRDWVTYGQTIIPFDIEVVNQSTRVQDFDVTDYVDTSTFRFDLADNPAGRTKGGTLGSTGTGPQLEYSWEKPNEEKPVVHVKGVLQPGESVIIPVNLRVIALKDRDFVNHSEISMFDNDGNADNGNSNPNNPKNPPWGALQDIDSTPDQIFGNDKEIDNRIDLTPATGDEDDEDIAVVPWWDLALVKNLAPGQSRQIVPTGPTTAVNYVLIVKNQGPNTATEIDIKDHPPIGFTYSSTNPSGPQVLNGINVNYLEPNHFIIAELQPGQEVTIPITYDMDIAKSIEGDMVNEAEITSFKDAQGNFQPDVDSYPDDNPFNDAFAVADSPDFDPLGNGDLHQRNTIDEDDQDKEPVTIVYSLGNQVWWDLNNDGFVTDGEPPIPGIAVWLFTDDNNDGIPDDRNGDGKITQDDTIQTTVTDQNGLYLFSNLKMGNYIVGIAPGNFGAGAPLGTAISSTPTQLDVNDNIDQDDNGFQWEDLVVSSTVKIGPIEPVDEPGPRNDPNADILSNLTVDFGFFNPVFDLALRKLLVSPQGTLGGPQNEESNPGWPLTFSVEVFNQGNVAANNVTIIDYLPPNTVLEDPNWTYIPAGHMASYNQPLTLQPGTSQVIQITIRTIDRTPTVYENYAEIKTQTAIDSNGNQITDRFGKPLVDVDSVPDMIVSNDLLVDNVISSNPWSEPPDEDDHDIAQIQVVSIAPPATGANSGVLSGLAGGLLLCGVGLVGMSSIPGRRRRPAVAS